MPIQRLSGTPFCALMQNAAACAGLSRAFGVSRNTVTAWLKKALSMPPMEETWVPAVADEPVEQDEIWTFVRRRRRRVVWL